MEVKICGLCRAVDAAVAHAAGARYAGVILSPGFGRSQTIAAAAEIYAAAGDALRVGVFVDEPIERIAHAAHALDLTVVQLHGSESAQDIDELRALYAGRIWKALRATDADHVARMMAELANRVDAFLLDSERKSDVGSSFNWDSFEGRASFPHDVRIGIAGGLTPATVGDAVAYFTPDFVDVSSGVEASLGHKSPELIRAFIAAAHAARSVAT